MYILINLLIFSIILFLYIHIYYHINTSDYLEIYEIDNLSKEKLEELCGLKQPLILNNISILNDINIPYIENNYSSFDLKIINKEKTDMFLPMKFATTIDLFNKDTSSNYISENNKDFLEETSLIKEFYANDLFLRPYSVSNIDYDIIMGSLNSYSTLRYSLDCRNYFSVLTGSVEVTLCPPKNYRYLYVNNDYENFQFKSSIDINAVQDIYKSDFDKVKLLRVVLEPNRLLQIPAYWFYSIKILEKNTLVACFRYRTYMNALAISPQLFMKFLQNNNIKRNTTKIVDL